MPSLPIERPSLTPIVLKRSPTRPAACTPSLMCAASRSRCMLQVLPSYHMLQMPTCGFCKSASVSPMPYSIACDAPWLRGCVTREEYLFSIERCSPKATHRDTEDTENRNSKPQCLSAWCVVIRGVLDGCRLRQLHRIEERHHVAQLGSDDLDR